MKKIVMIGAGGHGRVCADIASCMEYKEIEFLDANWPSIELNGVWTVAGVPDQESITALIDADVNVFVSIGKNTERQQMLEQLNNAELVCLVHPAAVISKHANMGKGSVAVAGSIVNAFAEVGVGTILNTGCSVDHDCRIGDFVHISPGARLAGNVSIGNRSWVGIGASIKEGIEIGEDVMIGAGAVVVNNVADGDKVMGIPARSR